MTEKNNYEAVEMKCSGFSRGLGQKLMFFMIGGGIGAAVALLFAPKSGSELREDIADAASTRYSETVETANHLKQRSAEYYQSAKAKGGEVLDIAAAGVSAVREEVIGDVEKIGEIVEDTAKRAINSAKAMTIG